MARRLFAAALVTTLLAGLPCRLARAGSFVEGLRFELAGFVGSIAPDDYNELLGRLELDGIDRLVGISAGVGKDLRGSLGAVARVGYFVGSTNRGQIAVGPVQFPPASAGLEFDATTIGFSIGVDYRIKNKPTALVLGVAGEINFATFRMQIFDNEAEGIPGFERTTDATILGLTTALGVEWNLTTRVAVGVSGGYRLSETEKVAFPGDPRISVPFDVSGAYGSVLIVLLPWAK